MNDQPAPARLPIKCYRRGAIGLKRGHAVVFGSEPSPSVAETGIELGDCEGAVVRRHCRALQDQKEQFCVEDLGSAAGTYVNGRRINAHVLSSGDLLQIGGYAWVFSATDGFLVPVRGINGVALELRGVGTDRRLRDIDLNVGPGEFLAIIGPSGAGKTTLIQAVAAAPGALERGTVRAIDQGIELKPEQLRRRIGYVSQKETFHGDLTPNDVVKYSAKLRKKPADVHSIQDMLHEVDLREECWDNPASNLSGGESKRLRTAAELIVEPRLLLLDEPASGLDPDREISLLRLLRSLALRGCTVIVVTHNQEKLGTFDRVVVVKDGRPCLDGAPSELRRQMPRGQFKELECKPAELIEPVNSTTGATDAAGPVATATSAEAPATDERFRSKLTSQATAEVAQFCVLCGRERTLLTTAWWKRLLFPVFLVPILFALALAVTVEATNHHLLGFLAVLSCIWMGASLSLMSIVDEREVFDHERLLFLGIPPYVISKVAVLGFLSLLQVAIFVLLLCLLRNRGIRSDAMLYGHVWVMIDLGLVSVAAVALGLLISAIAGNRRPVAGFILPLVMMAQIVFSVEVAGQGSAPLHEAYGEFHLYHCDASNLCARRAQSWLPERGWLCDRCRAEPNSARAADPELDRYHNEQRPSIWAAGGSYLTLSRYGDMALRSYAYWKEDAEAQEIFVYRTWRLEALGSLVLAAIAFSLATCATLWGQSAFWPRVRPAVLRRLQSVRTAVKSFRDWLVAALRHLSGRLSLRRPASPSDADGSV